MQVQIPNTTYIEECVQTSADRAGNNAGNQPEPFDAFTSLQH